MPRWIALTAIALSLLVGFAGGHLTNRYPHFSSSGDTRLPVVQVGPGSSWATAWDVEGGEQLTDYETRDTYFYHGWHSHPIAALIYHEKTRVGLILQDGRCVVFHFEGLRIVGAWLCDRKPPP